jgi:hypothetical protein
VITMVEKKLRTFLLILSLATAIWKMIAMVTKKGGAGKTTSRRAASAASRVLRNPRTSADSKTAAASALAQVPRKRIE